MTILHISRRTWISRFVLLAFTLSLSGWFGSAARGSEIVTHTLESPSIAGNMVGIASQRMFQVYLPDGYAESSRRYPVLYSIPDWSGGTRGYTHKNGLDIAIEEGRIPSTIAVFIHAQHAGSGIAFLSSPVFGNWETFLISELAPFLDREYRTIPDPRARALMGRGVGGYSAFILPVLHPGVWGAIGVNDPSLWCMWLYTRGTSNALSDLRNMPDNFDGYNSTDTRAQIMWQIGARVSPNPDTPLFYDHPVDLNGNWIPEVREKWDAYDLSNPDTLTEYSETLKDLLSIAIVVPESTSGTNRSDNISTISQWEATGINNVVRLDMPGGHSDGKPERFIAMAEVILNAMIGAEVSPRGKVAALWGEIKQNW